MLVFRLNQDIIRGCAPIADKDGHSFNESKNSFTLASPTGTRMPLSCPNSCRLSKNHCEDAQELDNQALNQAFFVSRLACVFQGPKHALQALYAESKESVPFGCQRSSSNVVPHPVMQVPNCEKKESHLQLRVKRPTPSHTDEKKSNVKKVKRRQKSLFDPFKKTFYIKKCRFVVLIEKE